MLCPSACAASNRCAPKASEKKTASCGCSELIATPQPLTPQLAEHLFNNKTQWMACSHVPRLQEERTCHTPSNNSTVVHLRSKGGLDQWIKHRPTQRITRSSPVCLILCLAAGLPCWGLSVVHAKLRVTRKRFQRPACSSQVAYGKTNRNVAAECIAASVV